MNTIKTLSITTPLLLAAAMLHAGDTPGVDAQINTSETIPVLASNADDIIVFKLAGDGQGAPAGQWTPASLEVGAWRENGPAPLINVPVDFSLVDGGGWLAKTPGFDTGTSAQILTDLDGIAQVWHRQPDQPNVQSTIIASALGKSVTFATYSRAPADAATSGANLAPAETSTDAPSSTAPDEITTKSPAAKPSLKGMLQSLVTAQGTRRSGKPSQPGAGSEPTTKPILPDEYFAYPADHPLDRMERGMMLYAASGKARELRDTERAVLLAAASKEWLTLTLEGGDEMDDASKSRCHYHLGKLAERYGANRAAAFVLSATPRTANFRQTRQSAS